MVHDSQLGDFTLEFHFGENEHFSDRVLRKCYTVRFDTDFDGGPEIASCRGCKIAWNREAVKWRVLVFKKRSFIFGI